MLYQNLNKFISTSFRRCLVPSFRSRSTVDWKPQVFSQLEIVLYYVRVSDQQTNLSFNHRVSIKVWYTPIPATPAIHTQKEDDDFVWVDRYRRKNGSRIRTLCRSFILYINRFVPLSRCIPLGYILLSLVLGIEPNILYNIMFCQFKLCVKVTVTCSTQNI